MISEKDFSKKEYLGKVKTEVQDIINEDRFNDAFDLSNSLNSVIDGIKGFKQSNYELYVEYKELARTLRWVGLPIVIPENVVNMFQYHLSAIFKIPEYDIFGKLKAVLLGIKILDDRDKFKKQLREAMQKNEEKITGKKLIVNNIAKEPTIGNWLADYNQTLGAGEAKSLARTDYLVNGKNIKGLNEDEKKKVKLLFDLYEKLKLSSQTFEGLEDEVSLDEKGAVGIIKDGIFEPFKQTEKQKQIWTMIEDFLKKRAEGKSTAASGLEELEKMAASYSEGSFERKAIEEEIKKLKTNNEK